jgi:hypothetical protein
MPPAVLGLTHTEWRQARIFLSLLFAWSAVQECILVDYDWRRIAWLWAPYRAPTQLYLPPPLPQQTIVFSPPPPRTDRLAQAFAFKSSGTTMTKKVYRH